MPPNLLLLSTVMVGWLVTATAGSWKSETLAGSGKPGFAGDGGPVRQAVLNNPYGLERGPDGTLYVCDMENHRVRAISPSGQIQTVAGNGKAGYSGDGGAGIEASLNEPYEIRVGPDGLLVWVEMKNHLVRQLDPRTRVIRTLAGDGQPGFAGDGAPALQARFRQPHSLQFGPDGRLYICDIGNHRIRVLDLKTGRIDTFAGTGERRPLADGSPREGTALNGPRALDFDKKGNLWLALREGNQILKLDKETDRFRVVAGTGKSGVTGNGGPAQAATLSGPKGLSIDPGSGRIFFADTESHTIRVVDPATGILDWVGGSGMRSDGMDGEARTTGLNRPHGVFVDKDGSVLVGDSENHKLRRFWWVP